jgi:hypothetical protein
MLDFCKRCKKEFDHAGKSPWTHCAPCQLELETEAAIAKLKKERKDLFPVQPPPPELILPPKVIPVSEPEPEKIAPPFPPKKIKFKPIVTHANPTAIKTTDTADIPSLER